MVEWLPPTAVGARIGQGLPRLSQPSPTRSRFPDHARRRTRQRHIDEAEVGEVLAHPDERRPSEGRPDRTVVIGTAPAGRVLFVMVTGHDVVVVVTVLSSASSTAGSLDTVLVTYDPDADATYVVLSDVSVSETRGFGDSIAIDLDEEGKPVGIELLVAPGEATDRVLSPLMDAYPDLITVRDALHRLVLPATA